MYYLALIADKTRGDVFTTYCTFMRAFFMLLGRKMSHQRISIRKKWRFGRLHRRPEFVGELSAPMHRTDKVFYDNLVF